MFTKEITVTADVKNLETITAFVDEGLEQFDCPPRVQMQLDVAIDELFSNIAYYAYQPGTGDATIRLEISEEPAWATLTFIDSGVPYDPLSRADPDTTLSAQERQIGGLGIFMVKKSMDAVSYQYTDEKNVLKIRKNL